MKMNKMNTKLLAFGTTVALLSGGLLIRNAQADPSEAKPLTNDKLAITDVQKEMSCLIEKGIDLNPYANAAKFQIKNSADFGVPYTMAILSSLAYESLDKKTQEGVLDDGGSPQEMSPYLMAKLKQMGFTYVHYLDKSLKIKRKAGTVKVEGHSNSDEVTKALITGDWSKVYAEADPDIDTELGSFKQDAININAHTEGFWAENDNMIVLAIAGTNPKDIQDLQTDLATKLVPYGSDVPMKDGRVVPKYEGKIHRGFYAATKVIWREVMKEFEKDKFNGKHRGPKPIYITGHSLGGAIATVAGMHLARREFWDSWAEQRKTDKNVSWDADKIGHIDWDQPYLAGVYTFGSPEVGDPEWVQNYLDYLEHRTQITIHTADGYDVMPPDAASVRFVNSTDLVPQVPGDKKFMHVHTGYQFDKKGGVSAVQDKFQPIINILANLAMLKTNIGNHSIMQYSEKAYLNWKGVKSQCEPPKPPSKWKIVWDLYLHMPPPMGLGLPRL